MSKTPSGIPDPVLGRVVADLLEALRTPPPELLDLRATLSFTSQSRASVYRGLAAGTFPPSVSTPSGNRWRRSELLKWIERLGRRRRGGPAG